MWFFRRIWPFHKATGQRRLEARRNISALRPPLWRRFRQHGGIAASLLAVMFFAAAMLLDVWPLDPLPYRTGQYVPDDIRARVTVRIPSAARIDKERNRVEESTPATFDLDESLLAEIVKHLKLLPERLRPADDKPAATGPAETQPSPPDSEEVRIWRSLSRPAARDQYAAALSKVPDLLAEIPVISNANLHAQRRRNAGTVLLVRQRQGRIDREDLGKLVGLGENREIDAAVQDIAELFPQNIRQHVETYLRGQLTLNPLYVYDAESSREDIRKRLAEIDLNPPEKVYDIYEAGKVLVRRSRRGDRDNEVLAALSAEELELLRREQAQFLQTDRLQHPWRGTFRLAGRVGIILLLTAMLCLYVARYQGGVVRNAWRALALVLLLLAMMGIHKVLAAVTSLNPHLAVPVVMTATIILAIAYDQRFARALGIFLAVFLTLQLRADFAMFVVLLAGVTACVVQLHEVRTRSKLIRVSGLAAAVVLVAICLIGLSRATPGKFIVKDILWASLPALVVGFLVQGILPAIERVFRTSTSMTLLEWCDASKPLLKRLATEAPGTYNHSLQLGSMCEAAAEAIGAQGLLARVGAYYHDIGKMNKPSYFVENQGGSASRHAKLSPAMSLLIITAHVKDGLELAREAGLPTVLHEFIATHHGTTLVQYFYHAAAEQRKADADKAPDEVEFRYPGPKPASKEAGILMLADASESSVRAMSEPTPGRIENQVHAMISRRLMDGQLDDCALTLREVHQIEASITKSLCSIYHSRIAYPTPAGQKPSAAENRPV